MLESDRVDSVPVDSDLLLTHAFLRLAVRPRPRRFFARVTVILKLA